MGNPAGNASTNPRHSSCRAATIHREHGCAAGSRSVSAHARPTRAGRRLTADDTAAGNNKSGKRILCPTARVTQMLKHTHVGPARSVFEKSFLARRCRSPALKIADKASPRPCRFLPRRPLISNSLWINSAIDSCLPSLTIGARLIWRCTLRIRVRQFFGICEKPMPLWIVLV